MDKSDFKYRFKHPKPTVMKVGGKCVGLGCQARIDTFINCTNDCLGCYAKQVMYMGDAFSKKLIPKPLNIELLRRSINNAMARGYNIARFGVVCDPGLDMKSMKTVLKVATECGLQLVVSSKSIEYDEEVSEILIDGHYVLQTSLGMISKNAPDDYARLMVGNLYQDDGVNVVYRFSVVITETPAEKYQVILNGLNSRAIVTPIRFRSKEFIKIYGGKVEDYSCIHNYMKADFIHDDWKKWINMRDVGLCGEVGGKVYCSDCMINDKAIGRQVA